MSHELNQNRLELRGMTAFNSFGDTVSASRAQMQASAFSQHYVINGAEPDSIQTGFSQEIGKYTYSIKTEHNIHNIVAIVDRYTPSSFNGIQFSPHLLVTSLWCACFAIVSVTLASTSLALLRGYIIRILQPEWVLNKIESALRFESDKTVKKHFSFTSRER